MATPLLAYKFNEAASGTAPTAILDSSAGTALNATITYGVSGAWTSIAAGRGLNYGGTATSVSGSLSGTKVQTALAGSTAVTVEWCIDSALSATTYDSYLEIVDGSSTHVISMTINHSQGGLIFSAAEGAFPNDCLIKCTIPTSGVLVIHVVVDSTQATAGNRVKVYVNGSLQSITIVDQIGLNAALDAGFNWSTATLTMGAVGASPLGITYEGYVYASALNSTEVAAHATSIAANNDADPNAGASSPVLGRRKSVTWDDDEPRPPARRRNFPTTPTAAPTPVLLRRSPSAAPPEDPVYYFMGVRGVIPNLGAVPPVLARRSTAALDAWIEDEPARPARRTGPLISGAPPPVAPFLGVRRWLQAALDSWSEAPDAAAPQRRGLASAQPAPPAPPIGAARRFYDLIVRSWEEEAPVLMRRLGLVQSGPTPPPPPPPPSPAPAPGYALLANQTTGDYDPNISLAVLLSVQDATGTPIAQNSFLDVASPFNDYALGTAGLLGPIRIASGRDLRAVKDIVGNARRVGQSNTPEGSMVQYPHLVGAMGLSFQMVGLMDLSGATYANVLSAAQTGGIYRFAPQTWPDLKDGG